MQITNTKFIPDHLDKPKFFDTVDYSYLTVMGSRAYGTNTETSDYDFYGFIVPPIEIIFPSLSGHILGFGRTYTPFEQYQAQHIQHPGFGEIDLTIYNIVKYFQLVTNGNPNLVDSIFTYDNSLIHCDEVGELVKNNRHIFLSEKMYHTFKGMAHSHLSRLKSGHVKEGRKELANQKGFDTKDAMHSLRVLLQIRDILELGELDIRKHMNFLMDVRDGEYSLDYIINKCDDILKELELIVAHGSAVPHSPNEKSIKHLLEKSIEIKFGSLSKYGYKLLGEK
jgi:predicted nucleotidyltransferase